MPTMTSNKAIFILEDNVDMQVIYRAALKDVADVAIVDDGLVALNYLSSNSPDLLILDINVPGLSGLELLRHVHEQDMHSAARTIISTANVPAADSELAQLADLVMVKPIDVEQLKVFAERLLA